MTAVITVTVPRSDAKPAATRGRVSGRASSCARLDFAILFYIVGIMKSTDVVASLAALAQESRLALFRLLVKRGPEGHTPTELSEKLEVPAPTLSFHLKELQRAGLIDARRDGRYLFYSPNFSHMKQLLGFLTHNCCALADNEAGSSCAPASADGIQPRRNRA